MHFVFIGGKGTTTIENIVKSKISGGVVNKYSNISSFVASMSALKQVDRVILLEDGIGSDDVEDFNTILSNRFSTARLILVIMSSDERAREFDALLYSPYTVVTYIKSGRTSILLNLCTLQLTQLKEMYGVQGEEDNSIMVDEAPEEEKQDKGKSGGLFSRLKGKLEKKKKGDEQEEQEEQEDGYTEEELNEIPKNTDTLYVEDDMYAMGGRGLTRPNQKQELSFDEMKEKLTTPVTERARENQEHHDDFLEQLSEYTRVPQEPEPVEVFEEPVVQEETTEQTTETPSFMAFLDTPSEEVATPVKNIIPTGVILGQAGMEKKPQNVTPFTPQADSEPVHIHQENTPRVTIPQDDVPPVTPLQEPLPPVNLGQTSEGIEGLIDKAVQEVSETPIEPLVKWQEPTTEIEQESQVSTVSSFEIFDSVSITQNIDIPEIHHEDNTQEIKTVIDETITKATEAVVVDKSIIVNDGLINPNIATVDNKSSLTSASVDGQFGEVLEQVEGLQRQEERDKLTIESTARDRRATKGTKFVVVTGDRYAGKTTVALKLAHLYAKHVETLYVDFDIERKGSLVYLGIEEVLRTASEVQLQSISKLTRVNLLTALAYFYERGNFHCLLTTYGMEVSDEQIETTQQLLTTQKDYSVIIIDCPLDKLHLLGDVGIYSSIVMCTYSTLNALLNTLEGLGNLEEKDRRLVAHIYKNMDYLLTDSVDITKFKENMLYIQDIFDMHEDVLNWTTNDVLGFGGNLEDIYKHI